VPYLANKQDENTEEANKIIVFLPFAFANKFQSNIQGKTAAIAFSHLSNVFCYFFAILFLLRLFRVLFLLKHIF